MVTNTCIRVLLSFILCYVCLMFQRYFLKGRREDEYDPFSSFKNTGGRTIHVMIPVCVYGKKSSPQQAILIIFLRMYSQCSFISATFVLNFPKLFRSQLRREH